LLKKERERRKTDARAPCYEGLSPFEVTHGPDF
jgi:hypothetical protein